MPSQLLRHLSCTARQPLAHMFQRVALEGVPTQWKTVSVTPVFRQKGDPRAASNYCTVAVASLLPKLFISCFNRSLPTQAEKSHWRAPA